MLRIHSEPAIIPSFGNHDVYAMTQESDNDVCEHIAMPLTPLERDIRAVTPTNRVRFASEEGEADFTVPSSLVLTPEMCDELWYQPLELSMMKSHVRRLIRNPRDDDEDISDLGRYSRERNDTKRRAVQVILAAQQQEKGAVFVQKVSQYFSSPACDVALTQGYVNFCQVYDAGASSIESGDIFYFSDDEEDTGKRKMSAQSEEQRNVRQRTF